MNTNTFYKSAKGGLPLAAILGLFLILPYGLVLAGSHDMTAAAASDGSYLYHLLLDLMGKSSLLLHCVIGLLIFAATYALIRFCSLKKTYAYFMAAALCLAMPCSIYAQTYAWVGGCLSTLPAVVLTAPYLCAASGFLYKKQKKTAPLTLLLLLCGLAAQFFQPLLGIALCLMSAAVFVYCKKKKGLSLPLAAHTLASLIGCAVNLLFSDSSRLLILSLEDFLSNAATVSDALFSQNLLVLLLITLAALLLLQPFREDRSKRCNRILLCLLVPLLVLGFGHLAESSLAHQRWFTYFRGAVQLIAAVVYMCGLWFACKHYVGKTSVQRKLQLCLLCLAAYCLPLFFFRSLSANLLYLPYWILVAVFMLLACYAIRCYENLERYVRKPLTILGTTVLLGFIWISLWNANTDAVRTAETEEQLRNGAQVICLPEYPYESHVWGACAESLQEKYYYNTPGDISFTFADYDAWQWEEYHFRLTQQYENEYDEIYEEMSEREELE